MIDSELEPGSRITLTLALFFLLVVVVGVVDLILDRPATLLSFHVAVEVMMVLVSLGAASYLARTCPMIFHTVRVTILPGSFSKTSTRSCATISTSLFRLIRRSLGHRRSKYKQKARPA